MTIGSSERKTEIIESVLQEVNDRLPPESAEQAGRFVKQFYADVAPRDLVGETLDNVFGAALALWQFGERRLAGTPSVRVYTPRVEEEGWHSSHTIVEVVTDDMPFLLESLTAYLNAHSAEVHLVIHPIVEVVRDAEGEIHALHESIDGGSGSLRESFMHIEVSEQPSEVHERLAAGVEAVLVDVRAVVEDFAAMSARCVEITQTLDPTQPDRAEDVAFLEWLVDDHFTFIGCRSYHFKGDRALVERGSGLGVLREPLAGAFEGLLTGGFRPVEIRENAALRITKANRRSTVHRPVRLDTIGIRRCDERGAVIGEDLFVGLFTSSAYDASAQSIPILRSKVEYVLSRTNFHRESYNYKTLLHILNTYPRNELFQIAPEELQEISLGILDLNGRPQLAFFPRRDPFGRFVSCLIYVPRERHDTALRLRFQEIIEHAYNGTVKEHYTQMSDASHARVHLIVTTKPGEALEPDPLELREHLIEAGRSWGDRLREALIVEHGEQRGLSAHHRFDGAFPASYCDTYSAAIGVYDIECLELALGDQGFALNLYRPVEAHDHEVRFKLYVSGSAAPLSDVVPVLENMGLKVMREIPYRIRLQGEEGLLWVRDFELESRRGEAIDLHEVREKFHETIALVQAGAVDNDGFNQLVLRAGLTARQITILRAYCKYMRQAAVPFSQEYMEETLSRNPAIARWIVEIFEHRFDPERTGDREVNAEAVVAHIEGALEAVANLDEDRILRAFLTLVRATLRTNRYQTDESGRPKPYLALKLDSQAIPFLPKPRPFCEVWVCSPRVEAVHLRGGPVARGGIRWSDRREDFRTEILGLMKAQMVKNTVIVPVGSKGGFVVKRPPEDPAEMKQEVVACYRMLMSGLLDLTDNLDGAKVLPPPSVVRRDGDDPYLVVAADKGTASFSDIANQVSIDYGFWLDDAFASGGSAGYDHKKMGITARGAWESVKRHFRGMGKDIQEEAFTVLGIGDMAGDVFGNGMLLSRHIKLLAAFNHMHVFVDPTPDPETSFQERQRLFDLPHSTWEDYSRDLISRGGGIWARSLKSIPLSPELKALCGLKQDTVTPNELVHALLQVDVELLWFGGIGTYVKATSESDVDVGDHANDGLRVDAPQLRAKVIGEGANLGMTHRARVEYSLRGGRLYTDFIDNSAGVDCSDHEVNIKILLGEIERAGDITRKQRNELLESMTSEVSQLVLRDNYLQTQSLAVTRRLGVHLVDRLGRFMRRIEKEGRLDRSIEFLPDDEEIAERMARREGLTRPELSTLMSYAKMTLYDELLRSDLPDDPHLVGELLGYFPAPLQERYPEEIKRHKLRREIVATVVCNEMVNRAGISFALEVHEKTGQDPAAIGRAYLIARSIFGIPALWAEIEALDNVTPTDAQAALLVECGRVIDRATVWFLRNGEAPLNVGRETEVFGAGIAELQAYCELLLCSDQKRTLELRMEALQAEGAPADIAKRVARLSLMVPACDIVVLAGESEIPIRKVAQTYFGIGSRFAFNWLRRATLRLPSDTAWDTLAVTALIDDLDGHQRNLARRILAMPGGERTAEEAIEAWAATRGPQVTRAEQLMGELQSHSNLDFAMLAVASRQLNAIVG